MPETRIPLHLGRVTSRDASLLASGEMTTAQDAYYKPNSPTLWSVGGRVAFNAAPEASALIGAAFAEFTGATSQFIVMRGTAYRTAAAGLTGSFGALAGADASDYSLAGTVTTLDITHYLNQHVLMNGVDRNRVVSSTPAQSFHGMLAANAAPSVDVNLGAGAGFTLASPDTMSYWVEERVKNAAGAILRRSVSATATVTTITGTGAVVKPRVYRPIVINPDATHWAVYATANNGVFPIGAQIGEAAIGIAFIDDTRTTPALPGGTSYQTLSASITGTTFIVPKNGAAPVSSTGDIFEDSLLCNDVANPTKVVFSTDDDINAFPSFNSFNIGDTKKRDLVVAIRALDNIAIILGRDGIYRLNTLPRPSDTTFSPARVKSKVHFAQGCVSPVAAATFSFGQGLRLAYVSRYGILVTDGSDWDVITDDMDWEAEVNVAALSTAVLVNNPRMYRLEFFYPAPGDTRPTRCAFLHYHPAHAKGSDTNIRANVTWPVRRDANAAFVAQVGGIDIVFTANANGTLYQNDVGTVEPVIEGGIRFVVESGEAYPGGLGTESRVVNFYVHHQAAPGQLGTAYVIERNAGQDDYPVNSEALALDRREATPTDRESLAESFICGFAATTPGPIGLDYFAVIVEPSGQSKEP